MFPHTLDQIPHTTLNSPLHAVSYPNTTYNGKLISPCSVIPSTRYLAQYRTYLSMFCHTLGQIPRTTVNSSLHAPSYLQPDTSYIVGLIFPCFVIAPTKYQAQRLTHLSMLRHTFDQIPRTIWTHLSMLRHSPDQILSTTVNSSLHAPSYLQPDTSYNVGLIFPCFVTAPTKYHVQR